jgi:hypothetical protein
MTNPLDLLDLENQDILDQDIIALLTSTPGALAGIKVGDTREEEEFLGNEEPPESPDVPYEDEEWDPDWPKQATHDVYIDVTDERVVSMAYKLRTWTPSQEWSAAPKPNLRLEGLRKSLVESLEEKLGPAAGSPEAIFRAGDTVITVASVSKYESEVYYPWDLVELTVTFEAAEAADHAYGAGSYALGLPSRIFGETLDTFSMHNILPLACTLSLFACQSTIAGPSATADAGVAASDSGADASACPNSHTLFLNKNGGAYRPGEGDDSAANLSTMLFDDVTVSAFPRDDAEWATALDCVREAYRPFNLLVTDQDPGSAPHFELVVTGSSPQEVFGVDQVVSSLSPPSCTPFEKQIAWVFAQYLQGPEDLCNVEAYASAILFTLEPLRSCEDIMGWDPCGEKSFVDGSAECGMTEAMACVCGAQSENSYQRLLDVLGPSPCP